MYFCSACPRAFVTHFPSGSMRRAFCSPALSPERATWAAECWQPGCCRFTALAPGWLSHRLSPVFLLSGLRSSRTFGAGTARGAELWELPRCCARVKLWVRGEGERWSCVQFGVVPPPSPGPWSVPGAVLSPTPAPSPLSPCRAGLHVCRCWDFSPSSIPCERGRGWLAPGALALPSALPSSSR